MVKTIPGQKSLIDRSQRDHEQLSIRVLTHNIRYAASSRLENERPWEERLPLIINQISYHTRFFGGMNAKNRNQLSSTAGDSSKVAFICLQEALYSQLNDILQHLNKIKPDRHHSSSELPPGPLWAHIGVGRDDGKERGEHNPILYPVQVFNLLHFENTWLSSSPDVPSRGWDAGCIRILTTGVFEHKTSRKRVAVFNTHLDHAGEEARRKSVGVIVDVIERVRRDWRQNTNSSSVEGLEFVLTGDFNSFPSQEAYKAIVASQRMVDVHEVVEPSERYGSEVTFTGFQPDTDKDKKDIGRIDYIWLGPKSRVCDVRAEDGEKTSRGWSVEGYSVLPNVFDDGVFCSDHRCVVADAVLSFE